MDKTLKIFTIVNNRLDLLELQHLSFNAFIKDNFSLCIVDNSGNPTLNQQFQNYANLNKLNYISTISTDNRGAGYKHAECLNNIWRNYITKDLNGYAMICDSDIFAVQSVSIDNIFEGKYLIAAPMQSRAKEHFWIGPTVAFFDLNKIPNPETLCWDAGFYVNGIGLDTGGKSYEYLEREIDIKTKVKNLKATHHINSLNNNKHCLPVEYIDSYKDEYSLEFFSNYFLHYARGSNWDRASSDYHKEKIDYVSKLLFDLTINKVQAVNHNYLIENEYYGKWSYSDK